MKTFAIAGTEHEYHQGGKPERPRTPSSWTPLQMSGYPDRFYNKITFPQETFLPLIRFCLIVLVFLLALSQPLSAACVAPNAIDSAPAINQALANAGVGGTVYLCRYGVYPIKSSIRFQHANQSLFTETFDTGNTDLSQRAWIDVSDPDLTMAVNAHDVPGSWLKWVQVWGGRDVYGAGSGAMLDFGGSDTTSANGRTQEVAGCYLTEPRGWTALSVSAGNGTCTNVKIQNNDIGPAGMPGGPTWADGISYQCRNGYVTGNYIFDATDGGIVVFAAPGTLIADNTIEAISRELLGGINLVDPGPLKTPAGDGDFRGTRVYHNTIKASGAFIHIAIASGPYVWFPRPPGCPEAVVRNDGAVIDYNTITGNYMGYGFAVDGVKNWTITNNTATSFFTYSQLPAFCLGPVSPPRRFQKYSPRSSGTFTGNSGLFVEAILEGAVGIVW